MVAPSGAQDCAPSGAAVGAPSGAWKIGDVEGAVVQSVDDGFGLDLGMEEAPGA